MGASPRAVESKRPELRGPGRKVGRLEFMPYRKRQAGGRFRLKRPRYHHPGAVLPRGRLTMTAGLRRLARRRSSRSLFLKPAARLNSSEDLAHRQCLLPRLPSKEVQDVIENSVRLVVKILVKVEFAK